MKQKILITLLGIAIVMSTSAIVVSLWPKTVNFGFTGSDNAFSEGITQKQVDVVSSSTEIAAKNYNRQYLKIMNTKSEIVWLLASSTSAATSTHDNGGWPLYGSSTIEFNSNNLYLGPIYGATAVGGTSTLQVIEK